MVTVVIFIVRSFQFELLGRKWFIRQVIEQPGRQPRRLIASLGQQCQFPESSSTSGRAKTFCLDLARVVGDLGRGHLGVPENQR
jgi:hypothetical protein